MFLMNKKIFFNYYLKYYLSIKTIKSKDKHIINNNE